jgi:hypothetical protein
MDNGKRGIGWKILSPIAELFVMLVGGIGGAPEKLKKLLYSLVLEDE